MASPCVLLCVFSVLVMVASGAPLQEAAADEPQVIRVKRADESLVYGNHQNSGSAREKKAFDSMIDGGVNPEPDMLPENQDKKAEVDVKTEDAQPDISDQSPDVNDQLPAADMTTEEDEEAEAPAAAQLLNAESAAQQQAESAVTSPDNDVTELDQLRADEAEEGVEGVEGEEGGEESPGLSSLLDGEGLSYDEIANYFYPALQSSRQDYAYSQYNDPEHGYPMGGEENVMAGMSDVLPEEEGSAAQQAEDKVEEELSPSEDKSDSSIATPPEGDSSTKPRPQRSLTKEVVSPFTAEDMVMEEEQQEDKNGRVKRDLGLTQDEVRSLLDEDDEDDYGGYNGYGGGYGGEYEGYGGRNGEGEYQGWQPEDVEELLDEVKREYEDREDGYPYIDESYMEDEDEEGPQGYGGMEDGLDEDDLITREQVARYLYGEDEGNDNGYYLDEDPSLSQYPGGVQELYRDFGPVEDEGYYGDDSTSSRARLITYNGEEGYFIPLSTAGDAGSVDKRSYMSFVPAAAKRFYPADASPEANRWSALLAGAKERRSEMAMSERLYRLARALGGEDEEEYGGYGDELEDEGFYYKKKK